MDASNSPLYPALESLQCPAQPTPEGYFRHWPIPASELHRLKATNDAGRFFTKDAIAAAEDAGSTPTQGFRPSSKSVKDCRLSARSALTMRSASRVGITGGIVEGAKDDTMPDWGKDDVIARRRTPGSRKSRKTTTARSMRGYR